MCFSASASFVASGGLAVLGGASFAIAKKEDKFLAAVPLLFAAQQGIEGIQWLYLNNGSSSLLAGYGFLFFALIVWPIYVPTFVFILDKKRRKFLKWFIFLGVAVALYFLWLLLTQSLAIRELRACVNYAFPIPFKDLVNTGYLLAIFGPLFISGREAFRWFGGVILILAIISWFFFTVNLVSVWCFFAAIVSSIFFVYIKYKSKHRYTNL